MEKNSDNLLIIFYRNPEKGKVKTRLAATTGDEKALTIYLKLAQHTEQITKNLPFDKVAYYSSHIEESDFWKPDVFHKSIQSGAGLGERMKCAFRSGFNAGYRSICIIGTDCYELTGHHIHSAFEKLTKHDIVIGPAADGGYYLLGMNALHPELFLNKTWSTEKVLSETIQDIEQLGLSYTTLPLLRDIDVEADLPPELR